MEQTILNTIEQIPLELDELRQHGLDQVELTTSKILLVKNQSRIDRKVNAIHVLVSEEQKAQARKAFKRNLPKFTITHIIQKVFYGERWKMCEQRLHCY